MDKHRQKQADRISKFISPFTLGAVSVILVSLQTVSSFTEVVGWSLLLICIGILPVFLLAAWQSHHGKLDSILNNRREQRAGIYTIAVVVGLAGWLILGALDAPVIFCALFVAGLATSAVFMVINHWWKISLHAAFVAATITVLVLLYGWWGLAGLLLLPPVLWARVYLNCHTPVQTISGAILASVLCTLVFSGFGLW